VSLSRVHTSWPSRRRQYGCRGNVSIVIKGGDNDQKVYQSSNIFDNVSCLFPRQADKTSRYTKTHIKGQNRGLVLAAVPILTDAPMIKRMSIRICNVSSDGTRCWNADFVAGCQDGKLKYPSPPFHCLRPSASFAIPSYEIHKDSHSFDAISKEVPAQCFCPMFLFTLLRGNPPVTAQ
jgi:hypothetical protein